ncbi:phage minor head protein [Virgibacillus sp. SK37]|uniref:phage head morphogenesis protein n=1 Tax=Virgibacillus sp. SK37 TaxID=403957 RepID=UPI0004D18C22|nr:phage minor head protein [Virgibacillus sp. SK37]AIF44925.1 phage head morphogenesis protein [Virgibacillus sp. SK37]
MKELEKLLLDIQQVEGIIQAIKSVNRNTRAAEIRLHKNLKKVFVPAFEKIIRELLKLDNVPSNDITRRIILESLFLVQDKFNKEIEKEVLQAAQRGANRTISNMQKAGVGVAFTPIKDNVRQILLNQTFEASERTLQRMTGNVMQNLVESYDKGLGIDEAADRLRSKFKSMEEHELVRIARTEINSAQNQGAYLVNQEIGAEYHMWITAEDHRVRDGSTSDADHVSLHGQIVRVGDAFSNGLTHPGDRTGPIEEWINCRCVLVPFVMPLGKMPPIGQTYFYESDLVDVA